MNKKPSPSNSNSDLDQQVYEVEKIINQRIINGKKQYKVIWTGYSFQEATWQPQENLQCPQKINEFLKKYQDVIRRKNLMSKNTNDPNAQSLQKSRIIEPQRISSQKNSSIVQKSNASQSTGLLNKQKLQSSLQKSSAINKKIPDIENLKSKLMTPSNVSINQNTADRPQNQANFSQSTIKKVYQNQRYDLKTQSQLNELKENKKKIIQNKSEFPKITKIPQVPENLNKSEATKVIRIQHQSQNKSQSFNNRVQSKIQQKLQNDLTLNNSQPKTTFQKIKNISKQTINLEQRCTNNEIIQERKISSQSSQSDFRTSEDFSQKKENNIFFKNSQRLEIQKVIGPINFEDQENMEALSSQRKKNINSKFFLIKNKFSEEQRIISRQRMIVEQPISLINFYEKLMMINQN